MNELRVAVIGAGIIGRTHIESLDAVSGMHLCALVDPVETGVELAKQKNVPHFLDETSLIEAACADAVIVASPNDTHVPITTKLLEAGLPVLLEKPVANTISEGNVLKDAVKRTGAQLLVGHHRRHNPIVRAAKQAISEGVIGELVTAVIHSSLAKPSEYFVDWRIAPKTGGPLLINLIHEIDMLRHFFGEIESVIAMTSDELRNKAVEETAGCVLKFEKTGMATLLISDGACGPWAWDISAGENLKRFPAHNVTAHAYAGTKAGLSLPDLVLWQHPGNPDWTTKMQNCALPYTPADPYLAQLEHFADIVRNGATPLVSCGDGVANMTVIEAIKLSARERRHVELSKLNS